MDQRPTSNTAHRLPSGSVVVPSFNHAAFIEATLRSIFRQTLAPAKLLVIDDGSTDDSRQIIERTLKDCPWPTEFIARNNRGLCATLNEGLAKTAGEYFAYLGSDDVWLPGFLEARVSLLRSAPNAVLAYGHCYFIDARNRVVDCTADWAKYSHGPALKMLLEQTHAPMSPTVLYRRSHLERQGWDEQARLEDYDLYLRLAAEGDFAFDPRVLSAWRQHQTNASRNFSWMIEARLAAQRRVADLLQLSSQDLKRYQRILKFTGTEDLLRLGEKRKALALLPGNLGGASSASALLRVLARFAVPYSLIKWHKKRRNTNAANRYGTLEI
jgi:alpha-1,3-rhamnosyltransferase